MEAKDLRYTEPADAAASVRTSKSMGGIKNQWHARAARDFSQLFYSARPPPHVNPQDRSRAIADRIGDAGRVERVGSSIDIAEHGRQTDPSERVRGAYKGEGGNDYFALKLQSTSD